MTNIRKRITTLLLAACMLLTALPPLGDFSQVSAAGTNTLPSFNPVSPEIVAENAISDIYFTFAAGSEVNGDDYLYLALRGEVLVIYNLDEGTVVDIEKLPALPRSVYEDEKGIIWICGSAGLFRYDPLTLTGTDLPLPKDFAPGSVTVTFGVTGDGNGKLYFGTGNNGYLGVYDTNTETYTRISDLLPDVKQAGYGGLVYKNGCLYLGVDGDMIADGNTTHDIIKYDIKNQTIVDRLNISSYVGNAKYLINLNVAGNVLFGSSNSESGAVYIDISGATMQLKNFSNALQHAGEISEVVDGKVYFRGRFKTNNKYGSIGYIEYDIESQTCTQLPQPDNRPPALKLTTGNLVTLADSTMPGKSIVVPVNDEANNCISLYFYNLQTGKEISLAGELDVSDNIDASYPLRAPALDPTGKYIYVGAGSNSLISKYGVAEGKVVESFDSFDYQTDSILYHDGYLYTGNYSAGTITKIDPATKAKTPLFSLLSSAFEQCRMWCTTFGGNKVFAGTTPYSGFGGMLAWFDFDKNLTYVAGGPDPEDVYYADTSGLTDDTDITKVQYTWRNAVTGQIADFDDNDDGKDDPYLANGNRRFTGPIENQVITNLIYKDGLLYGTTTASGSSGIGFGTKNALLFVYDVAAMKVIATCDLSTKLTGFPSLIEAVDQLAEDPDVPGKFWGVISGTLFTMTFDVQSKQFTVTQELSFLKDVYSSPGMVFTSRDIIFDGPYMYVAFNRSVGTYMILKDDPTQYRQISTYSPNQMVLAADGNLYWTTNQSIGNNPNASNHLYRFSIAEYRDYDYIAMVSGTNGISYCYNNAQLAAALAVTGNTVTLLQDVAVSDVEMAIGAVLDLNGHTLSGVVSTAQGTVKDSSNGSGLIAEKPIHTADGQVALKDGDDGYRVVEYTITLDGETAVRGNDVHFWYRVAFTNPDAYALAEKDTKFTLGAQITVNGKSAATEFDKQLVLDWASAMPGDTGNVTLHISILGGARLSMALTPTVSGVANSSSIEHTAIEGCPLTLNIPGLNNPLYGNVVLAPHFITE